MSCVRRPLAWCLTLLLSLTGCASSRQAPSGDPELLAATASARAALDRGQTELASHLYERALARARLMDDSHGIADAAYNLAACLTDLGQYQSARVNLSEAKAEGRRAGGRITDVLLLEAMVARLQNNPAEARALAEQVLQQRPPPTDAEVLQVRILKSELACDASNSALAAQELRGAKDLNTFSLTLRARLAGARGRIHLLEKEWKSAAAEFDREADLMRQARRFRSMSRALQQAGGAYEAAGLNAPAADRYYRAARSLFGFGDSDDSIRLITSAISAAQKAGAADLAMRAQLLSAQIRGAATRPK